MGKCLVTKLNGTVNNSSILRLGEMRFKVSKVDAPTEGTQLLGLFVNAPSKVEIIGDGYFTDKTLQENKGKSLSIDSTTNGIFVSSTSDVEVALLGKYAITRINSYYNGQPNDTIYNKNKSFNIDDLKYSTALTTLSLSNAQISGDIANLKNLTALTTLGLYNAQISGDIANLKNLTALTTLGLSNTQISGDIANLKNLTALTTLGLSNTQISGDIANLKNLTALTTLSLYNTQISGDIANLKNLTALTTLGLYNAQISGDIANLKNLTALTTLSLYNTQTPLTGNIDELSVLSKCTEMSFKYSKLTGNLAILPSVCRFVSFFRDKGSVFTWGTRSSSAKIIAIEGNATLNNIDKMLQEQAQCQVGFSSSDNVWYKTISVTGNRTSASDTAVQTLQSKGYTVSITPA